MFVSLHRWTLIIRKIMERKAFLTNSKHQYHVSQWGDLIVAPVPKRMEIIMSIRVCLISWVDINYQEYGEKKSFLYNSKASMLHSKWVERDCSAHKKRIKIFMSIQVCLISRVNINYKENGGKKSFSCKSKASTSCIPMRRT